MGKLQWLGLDFESLSAGLQEKFGGEWIILFRAHPCAAVESAKIKKPSFVIDASYYEESQELVAAADITITDYSSIMFESAFIGRPVFLYAPDKEQYVGKERELWIPYRSLPFCVCETNDALRKAIAEFDPENYGKRVKRFLESYGVHEDGHASERAATFIRERLLGDEPTG